MKSVLEKDTGTLQYDWFMNAGRTECVVIESYRDSAGLLEHVANLGETMSDLTDVCDMQLEMFGTPSDELVSATAEMGVKIYSPHQSI
jgi:hypothetical protein